MSSEWVSVKLKDVATIRNGAGIKQNFFDTDGVPLVRVTNFTDTSIDLKDSVRVNVDHALKWQNHKLKAQDILIATVGSWPPNWSSVVGKAVSVPAAVAGAIQNQNTCCIQAIPGMADQRFLYYLARSQNFVLYAANSASGSANQARLPVAKLECFEFHLPSLAEQKSIGSFLGALDDRITLLRETNTTLEAIAQALFKSWFVDFAPVHANAAFLENGQAPSLPAEIQALFPSCLVESPQGLIPEGWEQLPLYDIAEYINGAAYKAFEPNLDKRGLPIIKIAELKAGVTSQTAYSNVAMKEKYRIGDQDILFSWSGNPDTSIDTFAWSHGAAWLNQHIFKVVSHRKLDRTFVLMLLKFMKPVFAEIARDKQTTGLGHVTVADLKRLVIVKPNDTVLESWNAVVEPIVEQSFTCIKQIQTLANLRDTLLPRLISGQLRLPEAEAALAEVV